VTAAPVGEEIEGRVDSLDGLRALAVLVVMGAHAELTFFVGGGVGVDVFFTLSGFLITTLLLQEWRREGRVSLRMFYARRALRLLPALVLCLALVSAYSLLWAPPILRQRNLASVPVVLFYAGNWVRALGHPILGAYEHTWSLAIEEQFYLLWPPLLLLALRRGASRRALLVLTSVGVVVPVVLRLLLYHGLGSIARVYNGTDTHGDGLFVGCTLAILLAGVRPARSLRRWLGVAGWAGVGALVVTFLADWRLAPHGRGVTYTFTWGILAAALATAGITAYLVVDRASPLSRLLAWAPLREVGRRSYGIYLFHVPVYFAVDAHLLGPLGFRSRLAVKVVGTAAIAAASYAWVEQPFLRRKNRLRARPQEALRHRTVGELAGLEGAP
jgi:peptidoglycan/LPS O-acetylase OafA/YrhL